MADQTDDLAEPQEEENVAEVDDMKMSRTEAPEEDIDFKKIRDLFVYDGCGNKIRFGDIYKKQKTIIIFVRVSEFVYSFSDVPLIIIVAGSLVFFWFMMAYIIGLYFLSYNF